MDDLLWELGLVPWWAWWVIVGLAGSLWYALQLVDELQHERRSVTLLVRVAVLVLAAVLGWMLPFYFWAVERMERKIIHGADS
ncbi:MAG: hypothetical protein KF709_02770 [Gemmatimonadaceae bacterium]|nr:hypothetical protein [Gemmatimonadaceae bacterium]